MSNYNFALLATVSYGKFTNIRSALKIEDALKSENIDEKYRTQFINEYEIVSHQENTSSGYSGTIVRNKNTNQFFVLHRGTEEFSDFLEDGILVTTGLPYRQLMDAKAFVDENIRNGNIKGNFINVGYKKYEVDHKFNI